MKNKKISARSITLKYKNIFRENKNKSCDLYLIDYSYDLFDDEVEYTMEILNNEIHNRSAF